MLALLLASLGLLSLSVLLDDDGNGASAPQDDDTPEEEGEDQAFGRVADGSDLIDGLGTNNDDAFTVGIERVVDEENRTSFYRPDSVHAGAGDDLLYVSGGEAHGGEGNDTLTGFLNIGIENEFFGEEFIPRFFGGSGDDLINIGGASHGIVDAGEGDDTVTSENFLANDLEVTLGEGEDVVRYSGHDDPRNAILTLLDFDPAQDAIELVREFDASGNPADSFDGYDVTITPGEEGAPSTLSIALQMTDPDVEPDVYEFLVEGLDPSQAEDINISIVENQEEPEDTRTVIEPTRAGNDLVYDITSDDMRIEPLNFGNAEDNPYRDIDRLVLNVGEDVSSQYYAEDFHSYSGSDSGANGTTSFGLMIIQGPGDLDVGGPLVGYSILNDDSTYLSTDGFPDQTLSFVTPTVLAPFELVAHFRLGGINHDFGAPDDGASTVREVEVVINYLGAGATPA